MGLLEIDNRIHIRRLQRKYDGQVSPGRIDRDYRIALQTVTPIFAACREGAIDVSYAVDVLVEVDSSIKRRLEGIVAELINGVFQ